MRRGSMKPARHPPHITPRQWCCLHDAAAGKMLAPTRSLQYLWGETEDGAILHSSTVLSTLEKRGFIERLGKNRYVASAVTRKALTLPVRPR